MTEKENLLRALRRQNPEWVPSIRKAANVITCQPTVNDRPVGEGDDWYGVHWVDNVVIMEPPLLEEITDWREIIKFPDLEEIDWENEAKKACAQLDRENKAVWIMMYVGLFERLHALMGFEGALVSLLTEPETTKELVNAIADFRLKVIDKLITYYKPDVISMHDDYGTQLDLFMSPETWRNIFKDNIRCISDFVKSKGVVFDMHSCGKVDRLIGDFVDCGVDAWDSVQPCCDLTGIYEKYGSRLSFSSFVGIQTVSGDLGTEENAREEVRWLIDNMGKLGGLVPRTDAPLIKQEIRDFMEDEIEKYGRDFYKNNPIPKG